MKRAGLLVVVALGAAVSGCVTGANNIASADRPGTTIKITNPNAGRWTSVKLTRQPPTVSLFACKPLACAGSAAVAIQTTPSPTRHPDRTALEKAAKLLPAQARAQDVLMEAASEGDERQISLSSKVTEARGYPAIVAETKRTSRGKASFTMRGDLFIGTMLVKVFSRSTTREEAKRNFDEFVAMLEIIDVEPSAPAQTAATTINAPMAVDEAQPPISGGLSQ